MLDGADMFSCVHVKEILPKRHCQQSNQTIGLRFRLILFTCGSVLVVLCCAPLEDPSFWITFHRERTIAGLENKSRV